MQARDQKPLLFRGCTYLYHGSETGAHALTPTRSGFGCRGAGWIARSDQRFEPHQAAMRRPTVRRARIPGKARTALLLVGASRSLPLLLYSELRGRQDGARHDATLSSFV